MLCSAVSCSYCDGRRAVASTRRLRIFGGWPFWACAHGADLQGFDGEREDVILSVRVKNPGDEERIAEIFSGMAPYKFGRRTDRTELGGRGEKQLYSQKGSLRREQKGSTGKYQVSRRRRASAVSGRECGHQRPLPRLDRQVIQGSPH
jgi:hypothetical protein